MFGRHPWTTLPSIIMVKRKPNVVNNEQMKIKYDHKKKDLAPISPNTTDRIHSKNKNEKWKQKGMLIAKE